MKNEGFFFAFPMHHFSFLKNKMHILREHFGKCEFLSGTFARGFMVGVHVSGACFLLWMNQNVHLVLAPR